MIAREETFHAKTFIVTIEAIKDSWFTRMSETSDISLCWKLKL
jgi:hypothetical protein